MGDMRWGAISHTSITEFSRDMAPLGGGEKASFSVKAREKGHQPLFNPAGDWWVGSVLGKYGTGATRVGVMVQVATRAPSTGGHASLRRRRSERRRRPKSR